MTITSSWPVLAGTASTSAEETSSGAQDRHVRSGGARLATEGRVERLSTLSLKRVVEPDEAVTGSVGDGQLLPDELLSSAGLDLNLTPEQRVVLSHEEVASIATVGVRFESILMAGFAFDILRRELSDPRVTYILHEVGEETRHSRLFLRMISQLKPRAKNPFEGKTARALQRVVVPLLTSMPAMFCVAVLTGEEIPDLFQKLAGEHADTDPFIRDVNRYHRQEEARHLAFARMILPELWEKAGLFDRLMVKHIAPLLASGMFDTMINPGVYKVVGLPGWRTWLAANRTVQRLDLKHSALRPLLGAVIDAGAFSRKDSFGVADGLWGRQAREPCMTADVGVASKGERTRRAILEAAIVRFAREGYRSTSLTSIARDAGLSATGIYPYFASKESLFVAAVDEDAAGEIEDGLAGVRPDDLIGDWRHVIVGFLEALDQHPLARRVLAGLEPDFTVRLIGIPALDQLRKGLAESLEALQLSGSVRDDIDARAMASGFMTIWLSLLMSLVQTGSSPVDLLGEEVVAVFDAVMRPVRSR